MEKNRRVFLLIIADILAIGISCYMAVWLRFEGIIDSHYYSLIEHYILMIVIIKILVYAYFNMYKSLWKYASIDEIFSITLAVFVSNIICIFCLYVLKASVPSSVYVLVIIFDLILLGLIRFSYRLLRKLTIFFNSTISSSKSSKKNTLIVGAGAAGSMVAKEFKKHDELGYHIIGFVDDDVNKQSRSLNGFKVLGGTKDISQIVSKYMIDEIIIAIPSASKEILKNIVNICNENSANLKLLPGLYQIIGGEITIQEIRDVEIEDLLGRDPVKLDKSSIIEYIKDKKVIVTGGGGSIGSELCRQIAGFCPKELIILDVNENAVYDLQNELKSIYNTESSEQRLNFRVTIASVRDRKRIQSIIAEFKPDIVFHAAAHKHVPLMESDPAEAVKNNIIGTYNLASLCHEMDVKKFVLISTDKAVNPTNVMGATKRFCEKIIQAYSSISETDFVAVRFGNVLGSNGSVIPLFKRQIAKGGPVTVTHKDIIRYFMTIPEAAQLVLQAGAIAAGGEIFVLDMGQAVRIYDLARDLIMLSGFTPEKDIKIEFTGLRPGEKLYEELLMSEEGLRETKHSKIHIGAPQKIHYETIVKQVRILDKVAHLNDGTLIRDKLKEYVETYTDNSKVNSSFLKEKGRV